MLAKKTTIPSKLIQEYFPEFPEINNLDELEKIIDEVISELLLKDFEKLLNLMYRIDIGENHFKLAIHSETPSKTITKLIIKRLLEKQVTREKYR